MSPNYDNLNTKGPYKNTSILMEIFQKGNFKNQYSHSSHWEVRLLLTEKTMIMIVIFDRKVYLPKLKEHQY